MSYPGRENVPPHLQRTIESVCDAFETAWRQGERPAVEDQLGSAAEEVRPMLQGELIRIELEWRYLRGEAPAAEEYRARFPDCADAIDDWLAEAKSSVARVAALPVPETTDFVPVSTLPNGRAGPADAELPRALGEYEILGRLGSGGMGEVYRARHRRLNKLVALKLLPAASHSLQDRVARFVREMQAVGPLDHPNVVEAFDAGEEGGKAYLVMRLVEGVDLDRLVRERGSLPVAEACDLARQAARGLDYLHRRGLVHRDVKPSNLMRTPEGVVKVLDLGLARLPAEDGAGENLTGTGQPVGTPDYLSPEQAAGATVDSRSDLYGLGGTLFYLLTGRAPFAHRRGWLGKLQAHRDEAPPDVRTLRPDVPTALADLLRRLLDKEPKRRPQTAGAVSAALGEFAEGLSGRTTLPRLASPPPVWGRLWSWLRLALGVGIAVVLMVLAVLPFLPDRTSRGPTVEAVRVLSLDVEHFANVRGQFDVPRGRMGRDSFAAQRGDSVTVKARLSHPAYAYLLAFRPDGTEEVCFPENEDEPPPPTDTPRYPLSESRQFNYGLDEGEGLQVFALVVSSLPLPSYRAWRARLEPSPWKKDETPADVVWRDNGVEVAALIPEPPGNERGKGREVKGKTLVAELTDWLRRGPDVETVEAVGFAVLPKGKP
jgi:serine/threonine protein kinase